MSRDAALAEKEEKPHYAGHRQRLRERLLSAGPEALQDYELLELLLFAAIPQRDVKPLAKDLLARFGNLKAVIHAENEALREFGLSDSPVALLRAIAAAHLRIGRNEIIDKPVLSSWQKILDYCQAAMAHETREQLRILFLNRKNRLIADEVQQRGTIDHTPVYVREVIKRALDLSAGAIILVHNHPSGDPTPSKDDIVMTREVAMAARAVGITLHDHLIIGGGRHSSMKDAGLI
ncbi:MAG TPA: DNA repair protein RadC [Alphaproteobacteria bacterium]|nr:DNA repair protein RadC [Alphaproteobacteria bacterium]